VNAVVIADLNEIEDYEIDGYREIPVPYAVFELIYNAEGDRVIETKYVFVNEKYCEMVGRRREKLIGKRFTEVYSDADDRWFDYCEKAVAQNKVLRGRMYEPLISHWLDFTVAPAKRKGFVSYIFTKADREQELMDIRARENLTAQTILSMSEILSSGEDYEDSIGHVLQELSNVIHPDRLYVLETDRITASNTFEWCAPGVTPEIDTLQNLDYQDYLQGWEKFAAAHTSVVLSDIAVLKEKDPLNYENLKRQGIRRLMAVPFYQNDKLIGYLGADNYEESDKINTQRLLETVSFFIGSRIINHHLIENLKKMSRHDMLTGVHNRNAMIEDSETMKRGSGSIGVVYADINGLKKLNDEKGHHAGDRAICFVARILSETYGEDSVYREGGDEFVVLLKDITREEFANKNRRLRRLLGQQKMYHIAIGTAWDEDTGKLDKTIRRADRFMYMHKADYYIHHDRRHNKISQKQAS
jgi:diguanylate cyclase (GGDEF)-like protein